MKTKKTHRLRGHVSAGHGRVGKHRKHPGGRGNAGGMHHLRSYFDRYHPGYFGKVGMRVFGYMNDRYYMPIININNLWGISGLNTSDFPREDGKAPVIDVTKYGYFKVLGTGHLPNIPIIVKAKLFTKRAEQRIKEVGGVCLLVP